MKYIIELLSRRCGNNFHQINSNNIGFELSDRFELSDTIHSHIKKWPVNAWNSHK